MYMIPQTLSLFLSRRGWRARLGLGLVVEEKLPYTVRVHFFVVHVGLPAHTFFYEVYKLTLATIIEYATQQLSPCFVY